MKTAFWFVYDMRDGSCSSETPVCVLSNKKDLKEFVYRYLVITNYEHYQSWCELKSYDKEDFKNYTKYVNSCHVDEVKDFIAYKHIFKRDALAAILRMFNRCFPVGSSYETKTEVDYMNSIAEQVLKLFDKDTATTETTDSKHSA